MNGYCQVQLVDAAHQVQLGRAGRARQADHRTAADAQLLGLTRDGQSVVAVDHGFALSNPALASAWAVPTKTSAAPSRSCRCQSITWLACSSKSRHKPAIVLSSRKAASATRALSAGPWLRRVRRADFLTLKNAFSPGLPRPGLTPAVSTYRAVQICGTTADRRCRRPMSWSTSDWFRASTVLSRLRSVSSI